MKKLTKTEREVVSEKIREQIREKKQIEWGENTEKGKKLREAIEKFNKLKKEQRKLEEELSKKHKAIEETFRDNTIEELGLIDYSKSNKFGQPRKPLHTLNYMYDECVESNIDTQIPCVADICNEIVISQIDSVDVTDMINKLVEKFS